MIYYFNELVQSGSIFWFCALAGTGMFLLQFIVNFFGMGDLDNFDGGDLPSDTIHHGGQESVDIRKFKWLSIQAMTGFLMMFGWTAITCKNEFELQDSTTIGISFVLGLFAAQSIRTIYKLAKKLISPGSVYRIEDAVGKEGMSISASLKAAKVKSRCPYKILPMKLMLSQTIMKIYHHSCA